jgi:flagellar protein FliO/FliZ
MLKWLRGRYASQRVGVVESVQLDGKRSIKLVCRDNIEHLVLTGGRNDVVIEPNIVRRPMPKPAHRPAPETSALPPPSVPTREPLAGSPPKSRQHDLGELTRRLEAELRGSSPLQRHSPPLRTEAESSAESEANMQVEPDGEEVVPNDGTEKNPAR